MPSSRMWRRVNIAGSDVSVERVAFIFRVQTPRLRGTALAVGFKFCSCEMLNKGVFVTVILPYLIVSTKIRIRPCRNMWNYSLTPSDVLSCCLLNARLAVAFRTATREPQSLLCCKILKMWALKISVGNARVGTVSISKGASKKKTSGRT
jgi:hypothetical protein